MDTNWKNDRLLKWQKSRLGRKTFGFSLIIFSIFSILVYLLIYTGIPIMYKYYKQSSMNSQIEMVINNSSDMQTLEYNLQRMKRHTNSIVTYEVNGELYNCFFQEYCTTMPNKKSNTADELENRMNIQVDKSIVVDGEQVLIHFIMPLSSTQEVQNILVLFLPLFGLLSITMSVILSNLISSKFSTNILKLNEDAQKITNMDFNVEQSIKTDDELGDLSESLNKLAHTLESNIKALQESNSKLHSDIEKERIMEEERRSYIATLSHDLKTPLTAIKGQLEGMLYNIGKYKDRDTYLKKNINLVDNMEGIIQSIIVSSKLDDYNTTIDKKPFNISKYVAQTIDNLDTRITERKLDIEVSMDNNLRIEVDNNLFPKALTNIISNAVEYSDEESTIYISADEHSIKVINKSSDFDEKLISEGLIYKPFYRQDKARNKTGSGLGMYITKKIIDLHKFEINIDYKDKEVIFEIKI